MVHLVFDLLYIDKQVWFFCWVFRGLLRSFIIFGSLTVSWYSGNTYTWFHIWSHSVVCYIIFTYTFNYETLRYTFKLFSLDYYITLETWRMLADDCACLMWCKLSWSFVFIPLFIRWDKSCMISTGTMFPNTYFLAGSKG